MYQLALVIASFLSGIRPVERRALVLAQITGFGVEIAMVEGAGFTHNPGDACDVDWMIGLIQ